MKKLIRFDWAAKNILRNKAKETLDILKMPEDKRESYKRYLEDLRYQASMVESTYTLGKLEGKLEIAYELLDVLDDKTISEKTGLNLANIKALRIKKEQNDSTS